jgi:hypothetical protein
VRYAARNLPLGSGGGNKLTNFSDYRTYAWVRGTIVNDPLMHDRIVHALNVQLAAKGLGMIDSPAKADVLVAYHATIDRELDVNASAAERDKNVRRAAEKLFRNYPPGEGGLTS